MRIEEEVRQSVFDDEHHKLAVNLRFTQIHFDALYDQAFKRFDLTGEQFNVLRILKGKHPRPMALKDVQARMLNRMSNTSRLVERLRGKGLVERVACEYDRRAVDITLTAAGLALLEEVNPLVTAVHRHYETLTEREAKQLNTLLDKLRG